MTEALWISVILVVGGFVLLAVGVSEAMALAALGLGIFVVASWRAARPRYNPRRNTEISPPPPVGPEEFHVPPDPRGS